ncbi:MAG: dynamin family protein [Chitinivibrionales bacterium]|nr:dynamin family protein [Chitinivibrionales bacterium]
MTTYSGKPVHSRCAEHCYRENETSYAKELLQAVQKIRERDGITTLAPRLASASEFLSNKPSIDVAVIGQFKAGKCSLINSIMGSSILPTSVLPLTCVITRIHYGQTSRATVTRMNAQTIEIDFDAIEDLITENKNPENEKDIEYVYIETPFLKELPGLRLVDTPGFGSVWVHNTTTTSCWLPRADLAIAVIGAERPMVTVI